MGYVYDCIRKRIASSFLGFNFTKGETCAYRCMVHSIVKQVRLSFTMTKPPIFVEFNGKMARDDT